MSCTSRSALAKTQNGYCGWVSTHHICSRNRNGKGKKVSIYHFKGKIRYPFSCELAQKWLGKRLRANQIRGSIFIQLINSEAREIYSNGFSTTYWNEHVLIKTPTMIMFYCWSNGLFFSRSNQNSENWFLRYFSSSRVLFFLQKGRVDTQFNNIQYHYHKIIKKLRWTTLHFDSHKIYGNVGTSTSTLVQRFFIKKKTTTKQQKRVNT